MALGALLLLSLCGVGLGAEPGLGCVWLFDHVNYAGDKREYCGIGHHTAAEFNDRAESVQLAPGVEVEVYAGSEGSGHETRTMTESAADLGTMSHVISNLKITKIDAAPPGCVQLFDEPDFAGEKRQYCGAGHHSAAEFNDRAESLKVARGIAVELYADSEGFARTKTYTADAADLGGMSQEVSNLKIKLIDSMPVGCVYLYDDENFGGERREYCGAGHHTAADFNDRAESVRISPGTIVELYRGSEGSGGGTRTASSSAASLGSFSHIISNLKIVSVNGMGAGCVWLFDRPNFEGEKREICGVGGQTNFNDRAESVMVAKGVTVELTKIISESIADLGDIKHVISSIKIS